MSDSRVLWNIISIAAPFIAVGLPIIGYLYSHNIQHIYALAGSISTTLLTETLKYKLFYNNTRPKGANGCNLFCTDGDQSGKPGMPSNHSSTSAFIATYYSRYMDSPVVSMILFTYYIFVAVARYQKRCHSIEQIFTGGLLGTLIGMLVPIK